ncbi:MAG: zinc ribbon domain-containing protein [Desulfovibrio sp.]|nr:MAG: zinc ribbon domain-containing protein [Desulfovibrio sp.]
MICPRCEFENQPESLFCTECGQRLERSKPAPPEPPPPGPDIAPHIGPTQEPPLPRNHPLGLASFILGIVGVILWLLSVGFAIYLFLSAFGGGYDGENFEVIAIVVPTLALLTNLAGLVLGIVATTQQALRKGHAIAGICVNGLSLATFLMLLLALYVSD